MPSIAYVPRPAIVSLALPLLIAACATENNDRCVGLSDPTTSVAGEPVTFQSTVVPRGCLPPGSRSNEVPAP
jgi:hypothetical protein